MKRKYVTSSPDRHGRIRHRFRLNGLSRYFPGNPGDDEFEAAYHKALKEAAGDLLKHKAPPLSKDDERAPEGSVARLILNYQRTPRYRKLSPSARRQYDSAFATFDQKFGKAPVKDITTKFVLKMMNGLRDRPGVANAYLRTLKMLLNFAILRGEIATNPTNGVKQIPLGTWDTWAEEHIAAFENRWPLGTIERRILNVGLATGQRATDLVAIKTSDIQNEYVSVRQSKTGAVVILPIIDELVTDLAAFPPKGEHLIHRADGKGYTASGVSHILKAALREVGLPDSLNLHGLRKACCRRLAEAGATEREIMAVSGHKSPQMVSGYVAAADQKKLATAAMAKVSKSKAERGLSNP